MAVRIHIAPGLFPGQHGSLSWDVNESTISGCLDRVEERFPTARSVILDERGHVRPLIHVYIDGHPATALDTPLHGNEQVAFESANAAARARAFSISRFKRRADADDSYEKRYGPVAMEGGCSGGLGESLTLAGAGVLLLMWAIGNVAFGAASITLGVVLGAMLGTVLLIWGVWNLYDDLFN